MSQVLYFYNLNNRIHWGTLMQLGCCLDLVFRRKPVKMGHWYISGNYAFRVQIITASLYNGHGKLVEVHHSNSISYLTIPDRNPVGFREGKVFEFENKHNEQRRCFRNAFKNRLLEYGTSYFVPLQKGLKHVL